MHLDRADRAALTRVFGQAQQRGWIGPRSVDLQIDHSLGFADVAGSLPTMAVDLGSGGGLPALVLIATWPQTRWTLVESSLPRAAFLELHCARLGWSERVDVRHIAAELLGVSEQYQDHADLVTARGFGPPAPVFKAAAPLLRIGGELIVSAAPDADPWPFEELAVSGMGPDRRTKSFPEFHRATKLAPTPR